MSQEKFGFIRELTLPELWQLSYAIQERIRTLSMAPSQVWHIEIQQTGGYQPGLDQVVPPCRNGIWKMARRSTQRVLRFPPPLLLPKVRIPIRNLTQP